ncbi:hypothetical protein D3C71_1535770 [compost metagenome]
MFFRGVCRPFPYPFHDRPFPGPALQRALIETDTGVIEDEQAILQQLLSERFPGRRIESLGQPRQRAAEPATEQSVLLRVERRHEQPLQPSHIQAIALDEFRPEHHGDFLIVLRGDPDVAALAIQHVQRVVAAIKTERQRTLGRAEILLDPGVHVFLVNLHAL